MENSKQKDVEEQCIEGHQKPIVEQIQRSKELDEEKQAELLESDSLDNIEMG